MNKNTLSLIGFLIGSLIGSTYSLYEFWKYTDELEKANSKLNWELLELTFKNAFLKSDYRKLYNHMSDEEKEEFHLKFPSIPRY